MGAGRRCFIGHPMNPQSQEARISVNTAHPLAKVLPGEWRMMDEWYSFGTNPRTVGANVLLTFDESTYKPDGMGRDLRMGKRSSARLDQLDGQGADVLFRDRPHAGNL
jgi:Trehalose utilisation